MKAPNDAGHDPYKLTLEEKARYLDTLHLRATEKVAAKLRAAGITMITTAKYVGMLADAVNEIDDEAKREAFGAATAAKHYGSDKPQ